MQNDIRFKETKTVSKLTPEEAHEKLESINTAMFEIKKKTEDRMKKMDPNKAQQFERLGMGFGGVGNTRGSSISHSAVADMQVIEQNPVTNKPSRSNKDYGERDFDDDLGFSSSSKYKDFAKKAERDVDDFWNDNGVFSKKPTKKPDVFENIDTIDLDRK